MGIDIYPLFKNDSDKENCFRQLQENDIFKYRGNMRAIIDKAWLTILDFFVEEYVECVSDLQHRMPIDSENVKK